MNLKCVIFDCDGVLVDSETIGNNVLLSMSREHGLEISLEEWIKNFKGRSLKDCLFQIEKEIANRLPDNFETEYRKQSFEAFKKEIKPVKGVREFIEGLSVSYCVASSGPPEKIRLNLTTTGLVDLFNNNIFSCYQINSWKPEPDIYLHAASEMGYAVDECIVIEDSKPGVIAAVRGGFKVYGYANENNDNELRNEGAIVFNDFEGLVKLLQAEKLL